MVRCAALSFLHVNLEALFVNHQDIMANDPNTFSNSNDDRGEPKHFQDTKLTKRAPGGVSSSF